MAKAEATVGGLQDRPLTLEVNRWYSWQMLPGYTNDFLPYVSPILIRDIKLLKSGKGELELAFFNALYAQGVQDFTKRLRIVACRASHLVATEAGNTSGAETAGRDVIMGKMSFEWLKRFLPEWYAERPGPDIAGNPLSSDEYLGLRFFGTEFPWRPKQTGRH